MSSTSSLPNSDLAGLVAGRQGRRWCLFVDRDGVVNRRIEGGYVRSWTDFELLPGVEQAMPLLADWATHIVVVTNQQGIGKGLMSEADLHQLHKRWLATESGSMIDEVLHCPHLASDGCDCRKPGSALAEQWLARHPECDGSLSIVVGDAETDMEMSERLARATGGGAAVKIGPASPLTALRYDGLLELALDVARMRADR